MQHFPARLAVLLALTAGVTTLPLSANAAEQKQAAPAAKPAAAPARAAPAPHPAPAARAAPARPAAIARPAAAPHPVVRAAPSRPVQRSVTVHSAPQRSVRSVNRSTATVNRTTNRASVSRETRRQERAARHASTSSKATPPAVSKTASKAAPNTAAATQQTSRQQQRAERALRRQESRELRNTPRSQRAAKREEIRQAREQRAAQRNASPNARTTTGVAPADTRAQRRAARLAARGITPVTAQTARNGRFASRFAQANASGRSHWSHGAQYAWRHGWRAGFVPWYGPVFWPYAYSDIFDYAFWPGGYDDGYWDYAYDDFVDGLFWGEQGPPAEYVYAEPSGSGAYASPAPRASYSAVRQLCSQPGSGVTAWPFADIERKVGLNDEQKSLLGDVRKAADNAAAVFKASCPADNAFPLTPPGRLQSMTARLQATEQAVQTVRPALEKFYASLTDEQKERFNEIGPKQTANNPEATAALPADSKSCSEAKPGLTNLPIERIGDAVDPSDDQEAKLAALKDATDKAVSILQAACPEETPLTPPGRLEAMEKRLQAMIDAATAVKPALTDFYASLSAEQKARFNQIGKDVASKS